MAKNIEKEIKKEADRLHEERLERCIPVAKEVINIIANSTLKMGDLHAHDNDAYNAVSKDIIALFLKENVHFQDKDFIFQLAMQPFQVVRDISVNSLGRSLDMVINKVFGKEWQEVTMQELDSKLRGTRPEEAQA